VSTNPMGDALAYMNALIGEPEVLDEFLGGLEPWEAMAMIAPLGHIATLLASQVALYTDCTTEDVIRTLRAAL